MSMKDVFYSGNGTVPVDSGLPYVGRFFGIEQDGNLRWYQYDGGGQQDPTGTLGFRANSGNIIGNGFNTFTHVLGGGDGIILAIKPNGDLVYYQYTGNGEQDLTGANGFVGNNPGNVIGRGFQHFTHVFVSPRQGQTTQPKTVIFGVAENGDLHWYQYTGYGEQDPTGALGFEGPHQGNQIGRGFRNFLHIVGIGAGAFLAVPPSGDLLWYQYSGNGEYDPTGSNGFVHNNSGNVIGNGFQNFSHIFGGSTSGRGHLIFTVREDGGLLYYGYSGHGEQDPTGKLGFEGPNQGNQIGRGF